MKNLRLEDEYEHPFRMGRLNEQDARELERVFNWRALLRHRSASLGSRSTAAERRWDHEMIEQSRYRRVRLVLGDAELSDRKEAVVKVLSNTKKIADVQRTLRYITKPRTQHSHQSEPLAPTLFDELNCEFNPNEASTLIGSWDDGATPNEKGEVGGNVVAWHLIWSINETIDQGTTGKFTLAMANTVNEIFAENLFSVFWCLHTDTPEHPHVHLLLKARSAAGERVRFDKHADFLFALRHKFALNLSNAGLLYQATRREDRADLRWELVRGNTTLRRDKALSGIKTGVTALRYRAPNWWQQFGADAYKSLEEAKPGRRTNRLVRIVQRINNTRRKALRPKVTRFRGHSVEGLLPPVRSLLDTSSDVYRDPAKSLESILRFIGDGGANDHGGRYISDNKSLCQWLIRKQPQVFGETIEPSLTPSKMALVIKCIKNLPYRAVRPYRQITMNEASPSEQQVEFSHRQAAQSLKRLLAWFKQQPHRADQIEVLENRIRFVETGRIAANSQAPASYSKRKTVDLVILPAEPKRKAAGIIKTPADSVIKVPIDQSKATPAKKHSRRPKTKSRPFSFDL